MKNFLILLALLVTIGQAQASDELQVAIEQADSESRELYLACVAGVDDEEGDALNCESEFLGDIYN